MPERERKQKPAPKERVEETAEVAAPAKQGEELKEELDDLLDEIDSRARDQRRGVREVIRAERGRVILNRTSAPSSDLQCHNARSVRVRVMKRCADCRQIQAARRVPAQQELEGRQTLATASLATTRAWQESRQRLHGGSRHYHLKRRYGIGADEFDELVRLQGGVCAVCGRPDPEHVDHSHETGAVRGILCFNCNGGLGQFRDSIDALLAAAAYLGVCDIDAAGAGRRSAPRSSP